MARGLGAIDTSMSRPYGAMAGRFMPIPPISARWGASADVSQVVQVSLVYSKRRGEAVAELNRQHRDSAPDDRPASLRYAASGHPTIEQLMADQGTGPIPDVSMLHGDFWPE